MVNTMQKSSLTHNQSSAPFFSTPIWGASNTNGGGSGKEEGRKHTKSESIASASKATRSGTSSGGGHDPLAPPDSTRDRDRKPSFVRKPSLTLPESGRRRPSNGGVGSLDDTIHTDSSIPPAIPDFLANSRATKADAEIKSISPTAVIDSFPKNFSRSSSRATSSAETAKMSSYYPFTATAQSPPVTGLPQQMHLPPMEGSSSMVHTHIFEMSNKRKSTLEYLRKSYAPPPPPPGVRSFNVTVKLTHPEFQLQTRRAVVLVQHTHV